MEGEVMRGVARLLALVFAMTLTPAAALYAAQESASQPSGGAEISLRKSVRSKEYQGRQVEGEDRQIASGDSLWRILIEERGLPGQKFHNYLVIVRDLNPQVKNLDALRIGDKLFIPLRPDALIGPPAPAASPGAAPVEPGRGVTIVYRVKSGDQLLLIIREQLKLSDDRKVWQNFLLVKDLNPERKNWDFLREGESIRLPAPGAPTTASVPAAPGAPGQKKETVAAASSKAETKPAPVVEVKSVEGKVPEVQSADTKRAAPPQSPGRETLRAPAKENLAFFGKVVEALGSQFQQSGEEVVTLKDGNLRFDRSVFPVIYDPVLRQRVVVDPNDKIPASLKSKLSDPTVGTPILPIADGISVLDAVGRMLAGLGYQTLPSDRPVMVQDEGVGYEATGTWIALGPEISDRPQDLIVINLADSADEIPDYLKSRLAQRGLQLRDVVLSAAALAPIIEPAHDGKGSLAQVKIWPREKEQIVDTLLSSYGVRFAVAETFSVELGDGLRVDARTDRLFELNGKKTALFFRPADPEIRKAMQEKGGVLTAELDLRSLSSRELIAKVVNLLGDPSAYGEHRFAMANGSARERLTLKASGFYLPNRAMFVTDRQIPQPLHRFFFEKGLEIVYFQ